MCKFGPFLSIFFVFGAEFFGHFFEKVDYFLNKTWIQS